MEVMLISCVRCPRTDELQVKETLPVYIPSSWCLPSEGMPTGWRLFLVTIDQIKTISRIVDTQPHLLYLNAHSSVSILFSILHAHTYKSHYN